MYQQSEQAAGMEEVVVGVEDSLEMSDTEQDGIALETQQDSDSSDEDIADTQDTQAAGDVISYVLQCGYLSECNSYWKRMPARGSYFSIFVLNCYKNSCLTNKNKSRNNRNNN